MNAESLAAQVPDRISRPIVAEHLAAVPGPWRRDMLRRWFGTWRHNEGSEGERRRAANLTLLDAAEAAKAAPVRVNADDSELCDKAARMADRCKRADLCAALMWGWTVAEAIPDGNGAAMHARLSCEHWWRRQLRTYHGRAVEALGTRLQLTRYDRHLYVTHAAVNRRRNQRRRNRRMLEEILAVNEAGQEYTLAELSDLTVSNPVLRRGELMTRMAGFESIANEVGHVAEFWTITAPSRCHPTTQTGGRVRQNPNYDGSTPRDTQAYLSGVWARIRAAWNRAGIRPYGFRIAEPHHDGCPHWHLLLFVPADRADEARAIGRRHALHESPNEPGAQKRRFKVERIDHRKGTAAGYVAKYVAKNIDGYGLDPMDPQATDGAFGRDPSSVAERVDAWASTWGIRQFQQVGGPSVTVWRELRRMDWHEAGAIEAAREAADRGDWAGYVRAMGGPVQEKAARPVQLALWQDVGEDGEIPENRYGEPAAGQVLGVESAGQIYVTRWHEWTMKPRGSDEYRAGDTDRGCVGNGAVGAVLDRVRDIRRAPTPEDTSAGGGRAARALVATVSEHGQRAYGIPAGTVIDFDTAGWIERNAPAWRRNLLDRRPGKDEHPWNFFMADGAAGRPWSPVNNCTQGGNDERSEPTGTADRERAAGAAGAGEPARGRGERPGGRHRPATPCRASPDQAPARRGGPDH